MLGNVLTREWGEEYHATHFQTKCKVQIPKVVRVHKDIMQGVETQVGFLACGTGFCSRNHSGTQTRRDQVSSWEGAACPCRDLRKQAGPGSWVPVPRR